MPRVDFNSEIMYSRTGSKDSFDKVIASDSTLVFNNPHIFGASYGVLHPYPVRRDILVVFFFLCRKFSSLGLFYRLFNNNTFRSESLISGILIQYARIRKSIPCVCYSFIMRLTANAWTNKKDQATSRSNNSILQCMFLFFAAVIFSLLICINRTGNFPFRSIMKQNRKFFIFSKQRAKYFRKFLLAFGRHYTDSMQAMLKNRIQNVYKSVAVFLINIKTGCMIFLKRVILQINQNKEQTIFYRGKRTVSVDDKTSLIIAKLPVHIVLGEILIVSLLKEGEQFLELTQRKTTQRAETFFVILMICILHLVKVRACV